MTKTRLLYIVNPISGTNRKRDFAAIADSYTDKNRFDFQTVYTERAGHASELARQAAAEGIDIVAAVGGDGTVNEIAASLVQTPTALAIVPSGSGNGLARHLRLPMDMPRAIEVINKAEIHALDYGTLNGHPFFCTCGMGFDAFISYKFAGAGKRGPMTYIENVLKEGLKYKPETYEVEIEDEKEPQKYNAFLIACANASQYGNNAYIAPKATMTDGLMDVIIMEPFTAFDAPQISIDIINKTLDKNSKIKTLRAKRIHIHRNHPGAIHYDGDPIMTGTDVDVHIEERGIRIIINPDDIEDHSLPNPILNAFSEFFNNINNVREDIEKQGKRIQTINKVLLRKLTRL